MTSFNKIKSWFCKLQKKEKTDLAQSVKSSTEMIKKEVIEAEIIEKNQSKNS